MTTTELEREDILAQLRAVLKRARKSGNLASVKAQVDLFWGIYVRGLEDDAE